MHAQERASTHYRMPPGACSQRCVDNHVAHDAATTSHTLQAGYFAEQKKQWMLSGHDRLGKTWLTVAATVAARAQAYFLVQCLHGRSLSWRNLNIPNTVTTIIKTLEDDLPRAMFVSSAHTSVYNLPT